MFTSIKEELFEQENSKSEDREYHKIPGNKKIKNKKNLKNGKYPEAPIYAKSKNP